jgi:hypothetical protein
MPSGAAQRRLQRQGAWPRHERQDPCTCTDHASGLPRHLPCPSRTEPAEQKPDAPIPHGAAREGPRPARFRVATRTPCTNSARHSGRQAGPTRCVAANTPCPAVLPSGVPSGRARGRTTSRKTPCTCTTPTSASPAPPHRISCAATRGIRETRCPPRGADRPPSPHRHHRMADGSRHAASSQTPCNETVMRRCDTGRCSAGSSTPCPAALVPPYRGNAPLPRLRMTPPPGRSICYRSATAPRRGPDVRPPTADPLTTGK